MADEITVVESNEPDPAPVVVVETPTQEPERVSDYAELKECIGNLSTRVGALEAKIDAQTIDTAVAVAEAEAAADTAEEAATVAVIAAEEVVSESIEEEELESEIIETENVEVDIIEDEPPAPTHWLHRKRFSRV